MPSDQVTAPGSSPLSRGILYLVGRVNARDRIIPALAGNTEKTLWTPPCSPDHPRSRGEYYASEWVNATTEGSSPLSRGILGHDPLTRTPHGIIPALAGNTAFDENVIPDLTDHPRSRGEYTC